MKPLLPVLLLAALTLWSGTFAGGATFSGAVTAHAAVLGFCLLGAGRWRDPLDLGRVGRWLVPALLVAVAASWWLGPVRRAGAVGLVLLPAFVLIPAAVAHCWRDRTARRRGGAWLCLLLGLVAAVALVRWQLQGSPRAAMPLGHHNLLAAWLVIVWPVALQTARRPGSGRALAFVSGALAIAALAASGSLLASAALTAQTGVAFRWWRGARGWLVLALVLVWGGPPGVRAGLERLRPSGPERDRATTARRARPPDTIRRARGVLSGRDRSLSARLVYARAGWRGLRERPVLGWGPGSVGWTAARHLRPVRGLNPPSEIVGDLHSWPVHLAYELGTLGSSLALAIAALFAWRRRRELRPARARQPDDDDFWRRAAWVGLVGAAVVVAGNAPAHVLALPAALAVVAGAALGGPARRDPGLSGTVLAAIYVLPAVLFLAPFERAHYFYDRARTEPDPHLTLAHLRQAARLDPAFPLYSTRVAWLEARLDGVSAEAAEAAHRAARQAPGVAPLWLAAGALGLEAGRPWAGEVLERAHELDPLAPLPPFFWLQARPEGPDAVDLGAAALRAEPRLDAAVFWESHPELWRAVRSRLGWATSAEEGAVPSGTGPAITLVLGMDRESAVSLSLFAFRRAPWPADVVSVELRQRRLGAASSKTRQLSPGPG